MSEAFTAKLHGSVYFSPALQPHFHVCRTESDRVGLEMQATWFGKTSPKSPFFKTSDPATVRITQWEMLFGSWKELEAGWTSWNLLQPNCGLTGIMPAPEQPCSPASSHGRLRFRPVIVTTAHAQSSLSSPFSVGIKLLFTPWTVLVVGNTVCTLGICKTTRDV